ncbi:hypothetical protein JCM11641_001569 [Rhodosporidiobolus odoratus]
MQAAWLQRYVWRKRAASTDGERGSGLKEGTAVVFVGCTLLKVLEKAKKGRSGRLVEQAKLLYGASSDASSPTRPPHMASSPIGEPEPHYRLSSADDALSQALLEREQISPICANTADLSSAVIPPPSDLLEVYETVLHPQLPLFDLPSLTTSLEQHQGSFGALPPLQRCYSLIVQAWAARFSDHPAITGSSAASPPSLQDLLSTEKIAQVSEAGKARDGSAARMLDRALKAADEAGLMRAASKENWSDDRRQHGRFLLAAAAEQLRVNYEDPSQSSASSAARDPAFWVLWLRDAVSAALGGRLPLLKEEDLEAICPHLAEGSDEDLEPLRSPGDDLSTHRQFENSFSKLSGHLRRFSCEAVRFGIVQDQEEDAYVDELEALKQESDFVLLVSILDLIEHARTYQTHLVFQGIFVAEFLPTYLNHLIRLLCVSEGGRVASWTIRHKVEALEWMVSALRLVGWCFPTQEAVRHGVHALARLKEHFGHELLTRSPPPPPPPVPPSSLSWPSSAPAPSIKLPPPSIFVTPAEGASPAAMSFGETSTPPSTSSLLVSDYRCYSESMLSPHRPMAFERARVGPAS